MTFPKTTWADGDVWNAAAVNDLEQRAATAVGAAVTKAAVVATGLAAADIGADASGAAAAAQAAAIAASAQALAPTAVKTSAYVAAAGDFVPADISGGSFTFTLPTAPSDRTRIGCKVVAVDGSHANALTIARGGSDVFNVAGGATTLTLSALFQGVILQYRTAGAIWYVSTADTPLGQSLGAAKVGTDGTVGGSGGTPLSGVALVANVTDPQFGAKADAIQATGGAITTGTNLLSIDGGFSAGDVGKCVLITGAGAAVGGIPGPFRGFISSVATGVATLVTAAGGSTPANATTGVTGAVVTYGTDIGPAVLAASATGKRSYLPEGNYLWGTAITPTTPPCLTGAGATKTVIYYYSVGTLLTYVGTGLVGATAALTGNAVPGDVSLSTSAAPTGLAVGDYILLRSTLAWTTVVPAASGAAKCAEFFRVYGISGGTIYLHSPVTGPNTYATTDTATIQKMSCTPGAVFSGLRFVNATRETLTAGAAAPATQVTSAGNGNLIILRWCLEPTIDDVIVDGWAGSGFALDSCLYSRVNIVKGRNGAVVPAANAGAYGYLADFGGSQWGTVRGAEVEFSHGLIDLNAFSSGSSIQIPTRFIEIYGGVSSNGGNEPFCCHGNAAFNDFIGCVLRGGPFNTAETGHSQGFHLEGYRNRVIDPLLEQTSGWSLGLLGPSCEAIRPVIRDNYEAQGGQADAIRVTGANCRVIAPDIDGVHASGATVAAGHGNAIIVELGATGFELVGKAVVRNTACHALRIWDTSNTETVDDLIGINNAGGYVIYTVATNNPIAIWRNVRAVGTANVTNKPNGLVSSAPEADRLNRLSWGSVTCFRESFDRRSGGQAGSWTPTSGRLEGVAMPVLAGDAFTKALFMSASPAATFGSNNDGHWYIAVYDASGNLIVQTADQGITAIGSGGATFGPALASPWTSLSDQIVRVMVMIYVGTGGSPVMPSLQCSAGEIPSPSPAPISGGLTGAGSNTSGTAPGAIGSLGSIGASRVPYLALVG